jgi:nitroimidazol reductase NimA-like FMN-containing flavoprotein (pyridoxamine 5'-phosphate oxidase superfamily)
MSSRSTHKDIVKLPALAGEEVETLLGSQKICRMALNDDPQPYIIALDFLYIDGRLYFHFADYGRKMDMIQRNPGVSVEVDNFCEGAPEFHTITLMGRLDKVTDKSEMAKVAKALIDTVKARGGKKNVAVRHGLKTLTAKALTSPPSAIYRLNVSDYVALKSPG